MADIGNVKIVSLFKASASAVQSKFTSAILIEQSLHLSKKSALPQQIFNVDRHVIFLLKQRFLYCFQFVD